MFAAVTWAIYGQLPALAAELVSLNVDVLPTYGTPGTLAAKRATTNIPIVFVFPVLQKAIKLVGMTVRDQWRATPARAPELCAQSHVDTNSDLDFSYGRRTN